MAEKDVSGPSGASGEDIVAEDVPSAGDDLGIDANEELRVGDASMNADRGDG